jgi:hypothetical protein
VSQAGGAGNPKEGSYSAELVGTDSEGLAGPVDRCSTRVESDWGTSWFRQRVRVVAQDTDTQPNFDINLVHLDGQSSLHISNGDANQGCDIDIPLGPGQYEQQEAFPSLSLPMKKIEFRKTGSKAELIFNDGAVNYAIKNGRIYQTDY